MSEVPLYTCEDRVLDGPASEKSSKGGRLLVLYRGTSLTNECIPLGPYRRPMARVLGGSSGGGRFLMGEVPLYTLQL